MFREKAVFRDACHSGLSLPRLQEGNRQVFRAPRAEGNEQGSMQGELPSRDAVRSLRFGEFFKAAGHSREGFSPPYIHQDGLNGMLRSLHTKICIL